MKEPSILPIALYLRIFVWLPLVVPRRRLRDRKGKLHQRSEELARHNTGCSEDPATLYETDSVFAVAAEVGSLNADGRLPTGLGRFSGVSPPGGGTRVDNLRKAGRLSTMHAPFILLLGVTTEPRTTFSSSSESISTGFSTEPIGGMCPGSSFIVTGTGIGAVEVEGGGL
jgi:hypothetical protein